MTDVNRTTIAEYFGRLDELVAEGTELYIYGGAAVAALGADIRTTMAIDVAEPYSRFDHNTFPSASAKAGLPVNPPESARGLSPPKFGVCPLRNSASTPNNATIPVFCYNTPV